MRTVSIRKLHEATGRYVREAREDYLVVTDRGVKIAVLKPYRESELPGKPFPRRRARDLPAVGLDSTISLSEDREGP